MNEEDDDEEIKLSLDNKNVTFWKGLSLILALIIFLIIAYNAYTINEFYGDNFCENLEQDIKEKKTMVETYCVSQRIQGVNMTYFIKQEEE